MSWDAPAFTKELDGAVGAQDRKATEALCDKLVSHLNGTEAKYPEAEAKSVLGQLRRKRNFDLMARVAEAFIRSGQSAAVIRRQYAQSLLDQGNVSVAIGFLEALVEDTENDPKENAEARGLLGRAHKQIYMDADGAKTQWGRDALDTSVRWYRQVYESDPEKHAWHGINTAALLNRAARDGVAISGEAHPEKSATKIAREILDRIQGKWDDGEASMWDIGTAAESCVALGNTDDALQWLCRYVQQPAADVFELGATYRQLTEVWRLDASSGPGSQVLPMLRAELIRREDSHLELKASDTGPGALDALPAGDLEKILGKVRYVSYKFMRQAMARSRAVARVENAPDSGYGTGFLIRGADLHSRFAGETFLMTNAHVVSDNPKVREALGPDEATVTFQAKGDECDVEEIVWTSPPWELDATVLRLSEAVEGVEAYPVAPRLPLADGDQRVYVIGHPKGGGLSFSIQDNTLIDHDERLIHYRAPTEGGSSGSPVFNQQWKLIGLHHAGSREMRRLHDKSGSYEANEGIWIQAIIDAIKKQF